MRLKARLAVSLAAVAVAAYGFGPLPHGSAPVAASGPITYGFDKNPIASPGTLGNSATVFVTLTASDNSGPVAGATVYLALVKGADSSTVTAKVPNQCGTGTVSLTSPTACTTDSAGTIVITYQVASAVPTGGHDTITAGATSSTVSQSTAYYYSTVTHYRFQTTTAPIVQLEPLADAGNLASQGKVAVAVTGLDSNGNPVTTLPNTMHPNIFVSFSRTGGTVQTGTLHTSTTTDTTSCTATSGIGASPPTSDTTSGGVINLCYEGPVTTAQKVEIDTVTVQDTAGTPDITLNDGYNADTPSVLHVTQPPIASAGSLGTGGTATVKYTVVDSSGTTTVQWARVTLSMMVEPGGGAPLGTACIGDSSPGCANGVLLTNTSADFATDSSGQVTILYTSGSSATKSDQISGVTYGSSDTATTPPTTDSYNYSQVTHYTLTNTTTSMPLAVPIATDGTLSKTSPVTNIAVTALDASNNAVPNAIVNVAFDAASGDSAHTSATLAAGSAGNLNSGGHSFTTDVNGQVTGLAYTLNTSSIPLGGKDVIVVTGTAPMVSDYYKYDTLTSYTATPTPIAPLGSLGPNSSVNISILQKDGNTPDTTTPMWLVLSAVTGGGTAGVTQCTNGSGTTESSLSGTAVECTPDGSGVVHVNYSTGSSLPASGGDIIEIADDASVGTNSASVAVPGSDSYTFAGTYTFSPANVVAPAGTLTPGSTTPITVTIKDAQGNVAPNGAVYLGITGPTSGGTATVGGLVLTPTAQKFMADNNGQVSIQYTVTNPPAPGGTDTITAQNAASSPSVTSTVSYGYVSSFSALPNPIAPGGSLPANTLRQITVTANDSHGSPAPNAVTYLSFSQAAGGGVATVNGVALTSSPRKVTTDGGGHITVSYTTPGTLPASGVDTVTVANALSGATLWVTDAYSFAQVPTQGYWMVATDGGIFSFGLSKFYGSTGNIRLNQPIVGMAGTPDHGGYWFVASDGGVFSFGDAHFFGSTGNIRLNKPIVGMAPTPSGNGYWLVATDGGIFSFGDAKFFGSTGNIKLNQPIVGMAPTADGKGYWMVASDGGIFTFGDASFHGSTGNIHLNKPIVGMAATPDGAGYWMVASDGGMFTFGSASFHGSAANVALAKPIVGMSATHDGGGYWLVGGDGRIFPFGDAISYGDMYGRQLNLPVVGMASIG